MLTRIARFVTRRSLTMRFTLASFVIVISGTAGIGWWIGEQIRADVIKETATTTALYMDSFIAPNLQELSYTDALTPAHVSALSHLLQDTSLGRQVVTFKVWDANGRILYSSNPALIGRLFPMDGDQARSWQGEVVADISDLQNAENVEDRKFNTRLLQVYSPVRVSGTDRIIAVAEFYQSVDNLETEIAAAQQRSWLIVGGVMTAIYLLLVGFVRWASNTIGTQDVKLRQHVAQLTEVLAQNSELHERVRRAAASVATLDERFLRRISAELHDGPAQELGLALLGFDNAMDLVVTADFDEGSQHQRGAQIVEIRTSLQRAMEEVRSIAAGLGLPQLESLTLAEVITRVVHTHERRTSTKVTLSVSDLPNDVPLPVKITTYRLIQEGLNNAYRHARGVGQQVHAFLEGNRLRIDVSDQGQGFDPGTALDWNEHLGLIGMRERVESLGGLFHIESVAGQGTRIIARIPFLTSGGLGER